MTVKELMEILSQCGENTEVCVSVDTGRSYSYGEDTCVSFDDGRVVICGEEPEDFCP